MKPKTTNQQAFQTTLLIIACVLFAGGLLGLVLMGWASRYMQDDYCFDFLLKQGGFFEAQIRTYLQEMTFNGNRFSTNITMGLAALAGAGSSQWMPTLILAALLSGGYFLLAGIDGWLEWGLSRPARLLMAAVLIFLAYMLTPNLYQALFWRPASVTYSLPIAFVLWLAGVIIHLSGKSELKTGHALLVFVLAFITGGFAEHVVTLTVCGLALALLIMVLNKHPDPRKLPLKRLLLAGLGGAGAALLALLLSPAAHLRQAAMFPSPPAPLEALGIALRALWQFTLRALYRWPLLSGWTVLLFTLCGLALFPDAEGKGENWRRIALIGLVGLGLLFSLCLPGAVTTSAPPEERAQILMSFVWVLMLAGIGVQVGCGIQTSSQRGLSFAAGSIFMLGALAVLVPSEQVFSPSFPDIRTWAVGNPGMTLLIALLATLLVFLPERIKRSHDAGKLWHWLAWGLLLAAALLSALPGVVLVYSELPVYRLRAELWDWREGQIQTAIQRGEYSVTVPALDSLSGVLELQADEGHWVNNCAELFYGMKSIRAEEPVLTRVPRD